MAAAAVYISGSSVETPSIFEILAAGNLSSSIRSGFHHIWKVLIRRFPERFQLIKNNYDELYALFDLSLQYHYLKSAGGSFSENFYGLRRVCLSGAQVNESSLQLRRSLLLIVLAPYIARKLDAAYENLLDNAAQLDSCNYNESKSSKLRLFIKTYPYIRTICGLVAFVFQLYYLFGKSRFHSPLLYLAGVFLSVDAPNEEDKIRETTSVLKKVTNSLVNGLSKSLYIGAFLIQFLEWYHSDDNENKIAVQWKKLPPPKIFDEFDDSTKSGHCPICKQLRKNDTLLMSSSFVFCYKCIVNYLRNNGKCPVTGLPSTSEQLIRVFKTS